MRPALPPHPTASSTAPPVGWPVAAATWDAPGTATGPLHVGERLSAAPYAEPVGWLLVKNASQALLMASAVVVVVAGGRSPLLAASFAVAALALLAGIAYADRQRFVEHDAGVEIVELVVPTTEFPGLADATHHPSPHHRQPHAQMPQQLHPLPLAPLVHEMAAALGQRVDVT